MLIKLNLNKFTKTTGKTIDYCKLIQKENYSKKVLQKVSVIEESVKVYHLELLFFTVLALPNASRTGLD